MTGAQDECECRFVPQRNRDLGQQVRQLLKHFSNRKTFQFWGHVADEVIDKYFLHILFWFGWPITLIDVARVSNPVLSGYKG